MSPAADGPRTLTQMLREWDDDKLAGLLSARPDLAFPVPESYSQVASRATTRHSVGSALNDLDAVQLWIAAHLAARGSTGSTDDVIAELTATQPDLEGSTIESVVDLLRSRALVWGDRSHLRPLRAIAGLLITEDATAVPHPTPPSPAAGDRQSVALADKVGAGSAFEFVRRMDVLIEHCDHRPPRLVRAGGLSQRDIRGLADLLDTTPAITRHHLEIAEAAGLLGPAAMDLNEVLTPTHDFDAWQSKSLAEQWIDLVRAWALRHPSSGSTSLKHLVLTAFGDPADGITITAASLRGWLAWQRPRRPQSADRQAALFLELAGWTGVTGLGARTSYVGTDLTAVNVAELERLLPSRVDHVLVQADLTAVAPGPLTPDAVRDLGALADVESRGGATVYRFSPESLARARTLGWTTDEMLSTLDRRSRTPIPQALDYLIRDLERRESPGSALIEDPIELSTGPKHRVGARARTGFEEPELSPRDRIDAAHIAQCVASLRAGEAGSRDRTGGGAPDTSVDGAAARSTAASIGAPIDDLREAAETGEVVWFGYVDAKGQSAERLVRAQSVDDGVLVAEDSSSGERISVSLHRITSAHIIRTRD